MVMIVPLKTGLKYLSLTNLKAGINGDQLETQDLTDTNWKIKHSKLGIPAGILNETVDVVALTVAGSSLAVAASDKFEQL